MAEMKFSPLLEKDGFPKQTFLGCLVKQHAVFLEKK